MSQCRTLNPKIKMDLEAHEVEMAGELKKKAATEKKDPLKLKNPMSAYFIFFNERRAALLVENKNVLEVAKITGEEWKNMTDIQKAPYEEIAFKRKEQYGQEMEAYKQKEEEAANLKKDGEELINLKANN
ncbi:hypothetical protein SASPL_133608 [Salvia splendens]|uniref:HMG box domain-containing protein n=1 Tax=Salvia splendens TaxID=180675 RepID=A0A8X8X445_SALSN|nr:hypothetical protein SASPL_133608 [Salvia splendens]